MNKINKIGIALAAYRPNPVYFQEQLKSIQEQTFRNWVCVITFDSPLKEVSSNPLIEPFRKDERFVWIENEKQLGPFRNFEKALEAVGALNVDAIACSDQDDRWYPDKLAICAQQLEQHPPLSLVHSDMHLLRGETRDNGSAWEIEHRGVAQVRLEHLLIRNVVTGASSLFDSKLVGKFKSALLTSIAKNNNMDKSLQHDQWLAILASLNGGVYPISKQLFAYRQHEGNIIGVSPFSGITHVPPSRIKSLSDIFRKARAGWELSYMWARATCATLNNDTTLSLSQRLMFLKKCDFGALLFLMGLKYWFLDGPLARACLIKALGKFLTALVK